jgi:hypothetical protein
MPGPQSSAWKVPLSREEIRTIAALLKPTDFLPRYGAAPEPDESQEEQDGMAPEKVIAVMKRQERREQIIQAGTR